MSFDTDDLEQREAVPEKVGVLRGIRSGAVKEFVRFLKDTAPGYANPDMTVTIEAMSFDDLDKLTEKFLEKYHATDSPSN